jgi:hypothetical protein
MDEKSVLNHQILEAFGNAICKGDAQILGDLLSDKGVFEYQAEDLEVVSGVKEQFLSWIILRKIEYPKSDLSFTTFSCHNCQQNNGVLVFDSGQFPFIPFLRYYTQHAGLSIQILESQIVSIHFCLSVSNSLEQQTFYEKYLREAQILSELNGNKVHQNFSEIALRVYGRYISTPEED